MIRLYNPAAAGQRMGISIDTVRPGSLSDGFRHSAVRNSPERGPGRVLAGKQVGSLVQVDHTARVDAIREVPTSHVKSAR